MSDVSNSPQEPREGPCPWPEVADGACRQHLVHPSVWSCERCEGSKPPDDVLHAPARNAKVAEWIDWAVAVGADPDYARSRSRDELIEEYGDRLAAPPPIPPSSANEVEVTVLEGDDR